MASILFVDSYPQGLYGQQQTLLGLLSKCAEAGVAAAVATPGEGPLVEELRRRRVPVAATPQPPALARYGGAVYRDGPAGRLRTLAAAVGYVRRLRRWLRTQDCDRLYCNDMRGLLTFGLAARLSGLPVLTWDKLDQPHGWLDHLQLPLVSRNLVISRSVAAKYPAWQRALFRRRIRTVFDGVAVGAFAAAPPRPRETGEVVLGLVGSVTARKGHDLLLPAFRRARAEAPELRLRLIGDAPEGGDPAYRDRLMAETRDDPAISWLGWRADMVAEMAALDILVSPSRREGMGRVNVEAMAAGKPVIGAAGTGVADVVVEGETGFLVDPADAAALADRILRLARDPGLRARMGAAGRARAAAEFDQDRQLARVLDELLALAE